MPVQKLNKDVIVINPMIAMASQLEKDATAAPNATARFLAYVKKIKLPLTAKIIEAVVSKYGNKVAKVAENSTVTKFEEQIFNHVMSKLSSDEKPEDVLKVFEVVGAGIDKMVSNANDSIESEEFVNKIKSSLDDGTFFNVFSEKSN